MHPRRILLPSDVSVPPDLLTALHTSQRFILCGHARPDGDAIGSVMALANALRALGRTDVRTISADPAPGPFLDLPDMAGFEVVSEVDATGATVIVMESGSLERTGIRGLDAGLVINIDHHVGNTGYGAVTWFDETAAANGELVADLIDALGVVWTPTIATHLYVAVLTDTGSFRHSHISPRTFELARRCVERGADPVALYRQMYDSYSLGRLRLMGDLLHGMTLEAGGRLAVLRLTPEVHARTGSTPDESDGLVNLPFSAKDVQAVLLLREDADGRSRVSLRSREAIDVRAVAQQFGGGGHRNASGFTSDRSLDDLRAALLPLLEAAVAQPSA
jgi:phosphoesterase RecJ-like protein